MTDFKDQLDNDINVGDQLVQSYSIGSSSGLRRCVVTGFTPQMMRVQPMEFKRVFRRFQNPPPRGRQGEYVLSDPLELVSERTVKPGHNVLIVNREIWPELEEARANGILI